MNLKMSSISDNISVRFIIILSLLLLPNSLYAGDIKVAFVDLQKALNESESGKKAFEHLQEMYNKEKEIIKVREDKVRMLLTEITKQGLLMSENTRMEKEEEYKREKKNLDRYVEDSNNELLRKEKEMTQKILMEIINIVQQMGEKDGYTLIFEKRESILYANDTIDITNKVIEAFNKKTSNINTNTKKKDS